MRTDEDRAYHRDWYANNKERRKVQIRAQKAAMKRLVQEVKEAGSCLHCGEDHPACLDFHHRDPSTKLGSLANIERLGWGREKILAEIKKCDLLCSNCHRKLHYNSPV